MCFLEPDELESSLYGHVIDEITNNDRQLVAQAIAAAVQEVKSFLYTRYDVEHIFDKRGDERNALILENVKTVTVWNVIKLCNAETIYDMWRDRYDRVINWLKEVAKGAAVADLPLLTDNNGDAVLKIRMSSNPKFHHSF